MSSTNDHLASEVAALRQENAQLLRRLEALEARLSGPAAAPDPVVAPGRAAVSRRGLLLATGAGTVAASVGFVHARPALADSGDPLVTRMDFSDPPVAPSALDTAVRWARRDPVGVPNHHTNEILSLISENTQVNSYAWPLYIELRTTSATAATRDTSQSCGATVRMFASSAGSPWNTGFHSELQHGRQWTPDGIIPRSTNSTSIGYNMELYRVSGGGTTVGVVVLNSSSSAYPGDSAIRILGRWNQGIFFPATAGAEKAGGAAIDVQAPYELGLNLGPNDMCLAPGRRIILDQEHGVWLTYNRSTAKVEIHRHGELAASL
ncbi:MAG TPA: hypothetical protein VFC19_54500 [Candidatus Limnocylindrales bacterium]|nr:hypothetical protein [Candidatus Limnocylindrales bacterium]